MSRFRWICVLPLTTAATFLFPSATYAQQHCKSAARETTPRAADSPSSRPPPLRPMTFPSFSPAPSQLPPAEAARVRLLDGQLTVEARNSELAQILADVARVTGARVTGGISGGPRIFGFYGPADARTVLTSLLSGTGYNFLVLGDRPFPREVVITPERKPPVTVVQAAKPEPEDENLDRYSAADFNPD